MTDERSGVPAGDAMPDGVSAVDLALVTTEDLLKALESRHAKMVFLAELPGSKDPATGGSLTPFPTMWFRGTPGDCVGLIAWGGMRLRQVLWAGLTEMFPLRPGGPGDPGAD